MVTKLRCKNPPVLRRKIKAIANIINRTYATIAKNLDLSNRQAAKNAKKTIMRKS
ncbi:hypothetical protein PN456_17105 [Nodularia spumigena CS-586/05]|uniref:hypothetical protein n=1 Tax=Nodularia spumigena TaxID=70799 RepID=UPI00232BD64F|nr:hypothetical protein [Nodularia spumigena]MDB9342733.1 hypothetical protein [Nodularia spumigena CS-588/06]MDB9370645.1 hypothetical protein [Nodularia spumigena CS-586/05]